MNEEEKNERLRLLQNLIGMAGSDHEINKIEFSFLLDLAHQMGLSKNELKELFEQFLEFHPPKLEPERILQFHRLVLLMQVDEQVLPEEIEYIQRIGLKMGLHPDAVNEVLRTMGSYTHGIIPPEKLISIFKTYHN